MGLEIVDQLSLDVEEFQRRSALDLKDEKEKVRIYEIEEQISKHQNEIKNIDERIVKIQDQLTKVQYDIRQTDITLSQKGIAYYDKEKEYKKEQAEINDKIGELNSQIIEVAGGDSPLMIVKKELEEILVQSKQLNKSLNSENLNKEINSLIKEFESFSKKNCSDKEYLEKLGKFIKKKKLNQYNEKFDSEFILKNLNFNQINFLLDDGLDKIHKDAQKLIKSKSKYEEEFEKISQLINKIPTTDEIKPIIEKQKKLSREELELKTKINVLNTERQKSNGPVLKLSAELKQEYEKKTSQDLANLDTKRFIDYSIKVKDILSSFHVKALDYHIKRLEKLILDCFKTLHRKKNFIKSIKIDTINFDLFIKDQKNNEIDTEDLSAGERQLLAVAILWGLAKASNSAAPTIIDTPLGRLDSDHRLNLVEKYFPTASKQVILLSTDEEINKKYHKYMAPYLSRSYKIEYDEKLNGSKIEEGYFF